MRSAFGVERTETDAAVYILSALIAFGCAVLLLRSFAFARNALLVWAGVCFVGMALNNVMLFLDEFVIRHTDLSAWRTAPALGGMLALVFALVWEET
jgi:hypothetical protein